MAATFDTLTLEQCREARDLLGWSQERLAGEAGLAPRTIGDFERGSRPTLPASIALIRRALEAAGVEFIPDGGRLRDEPSPEETILPGPAAEAS